MKKTKTFYEGILDNLYDGIYFVDRTRKITYWNKAAERITGFRRSEVLGAPCHDHILNHINDEGDPLCQSECPLAKCIETGQPTEAEAYLHHKEGYRLPVSIRVTPILDQDGNVIGAAISPDGRYVAYVESEHGLQSLWLQQLAGGQTLRLVAEQPVAYWGHTFSPDGNAIYYGIKGDGEPRGALFSISTLGGTPRRLLRDLDSAVSFSPDGKKIAFLRLRHPSAEESSLMVAGADGSDPKALATFRLPEYVAGIFYGAPSWSPDSRHIATTVGVRGGAGAESRARLALVGVEDGKVTTLADPGWEAAAQCGWLPDGRSLLVIARSGDQPSTQVWAVSYPGGEARKVTNDLNDRRIISLTADGRSLVSVAGAVSSTVWSAPLRGSGRPRRMSRGTTDGIDGVVFSADGKLVYTSDTGSTTGLGTTGADGAERGPLLDLPAEALRSIAIE